MDPAKVRRTSSITSTNNQQPRGSLKSVRTTSSNAIDLLAAVCQEDLRKKRRRPGRCIDKSGECNFEVIHVVKEGKRFFRDIFTSLVEVQWRWIILILCLMYFGSWTLFAVAWYILLYYHEDIQNFEVPDWDPCVTGIHNFATAYLFSVETQHTTGYGSYHINDHCPQAIGLMCIQSIVGVLIEGMMVGIVFVKLTRAKNRSATIAFSMNAVICQRDGKLCLMFRVGDLRTKTHVLQTSIRAQVIRRKPTLEGEIIEYHQDELQISNCKEKTGKILLFWPITVTHVIDRSSPLYYLEPGDLTTDNDKFEIIVVLEGVVETTGMVMQAKTSYLPSEIAWGHRFQDLTSKKSVLTGERLIDFSRFHNTELSPLTTTLSAAQLEALTRTSTTSRTTVT